MLKFRGMSLEMADSDTEFRPYYEEIARRRELVLPKCSECDLVRYPPGPGCPYCSSLEWEWKAMSGEGTIVSYTIVTHVIQPGFADWAPYPVVIVELEEQRGVPTPENNLRMPANLVDSEFRPELEDRVAIGARVKLVLQEIGEGFLLPQFALTGESEGETWSLSQYE